MPTLSLTRRFTFEMAHALDGYDGLCRHIHGHSYKMLVTVDGSPSLDKSSPKLGMIIDFTVLKAIVNEAVINKYDHALVVRKGSIEPRLAASLQVQWGNLLEVDFQPTCENMIVEFARVLQPRMPAGVTLSQIQLYETENSYATYRP